jgi:hypothetical protein
MSILVKHQPWYSGPPSHSEIASEIDWNMWQVRQQPYAELETGARLILVSGGGPTGGLLTWEVEAKAVVKGPYSSHREAWQLLRTGLDPDKALSRRAFLEAEYTLDAPDEGWLLACTYRPVRSIMRPRPPSLRFRPNGWARLSMSSLETMLES